jgi:hypothetical protein
LAKSARRLKHEATKEKKGEKRRHRLALPTIYEFANSINLQCARRLGCISLGCCWRIQNWKLGTLFFWSFLSYSRFTGFVSSCFKPRADFANSIHLRGTRVLPCRARHASPPGLWRIEQPARFLSRAVFVFCVEKEAQERAEAYKALVMPDKRASFSRQSYGVGARMGWKTCAPHKAAR